MQIFEYVMYLEKKKNGLEPDPNSLLPYYCSQFCEDEKKDSLSFWEGLHMLFTYRYL